MDCILVRVPCTFFVLRSTIREGLKGGIKEEYAVRLAVWLKLAPLFAVTNKTNYLHVFALHREDQICLSEMELAALRSAYRTGRTNHGLAKDEAVEFANRDIKQAVGDQPTAESVQFVSGAFNTIQDYLENFDRRHGIGGGTYTKPPLDGNVAHLFDFLLRNDFAWPERSGIETLHHFKTKELIDEKLHNLSTTASNRLEKYIRQHVFDEKLEVKSDVSSLSIDPKSAKKKNRKTKRKDDEQKERKRKR